MIPYIGDISSQDALVLKALATDSKNILEFGCGASTQVLASATEGSVMSIDTEPSWIDKTEGNLKLFGLEEKVHFHNYKEFMNHVLIEAPFDLIFDDGADGLRREFAVKTWPYLKVYGCMVFHDTRRAHDFRNVLEVLAIFQDEIEDVNFNAVGSNLTVIFKKEPEPYDNWQITEKREPWQLGYGDLPQSFIDSLKDKQNTLKTS